MRTQSGSLYKIGTRRYVDSQAVYNIAGAHDVVPLPNDWRIMVNKDSIRCAIVEHRPELPGQRGALYELTAEASASLKAERSAWISRRLVEAVGTFDAWPGEAVSAGCGCSVKSCSCGPCRAKHADHDHDHH